MSDNKNEITEDDIYEFLEKLNELGQINIADDYTNEEIEEAILELSQEAKMNKDSN